MVVGHLLRNLAIVAAAVVFGWYAARRWRIGGTPQPRPASREYLAGLNFLVQDQHGQPMGEEAFVAFEGPARGIDLETQRAAATEARKSSK